MALYIAGGSALAASSRLALGSPCTGHQFTLRATKDATNNLNYTDKIVQVEYVWGSMVSVTVGSTGSTASVKLEPKS